MRREVVNHPWDELKKFRGTIVSGEWPTLPELLRLSEVKFGNKVAFSVFQGKDKITYTFSQILEIARHEAAYLKAKGMKKGDKVMLMGRNSPDWALSYFAIPEADSVFERRCLEFC